MVSVNSLAPGKFEWNFRHVIFKQILVIDDLGISCEIALTWKPQDLTDDKSTLVQVMAWCHQATSHYLSQCWPRSPYGITKPHWVIFCWLKGLLGSVSHWSWILHWYPYSEHDKMWSCYNMSNIVIHNSQGVYQKIQFISQNMHLFLLCLFCCGFIILMLLCLFCCGFIVLVNSCELFTYIL